MPGHQPIIFLQYFSKTACHVNANKMGPREVPAPPKFASTFCLLDWIPLPPPAWIPFVRA